MLEIKDLHASINGKEILKGINLTVNPGEIHALMGQNGAGKSTMMNVLCGLYKPTSGQIFINEKEVHFNSPKDAIDMGIGMVHQHFKLVSNYTIAENIVMGMEPVKKVLGLMKSE